MVYFDVVHRIRTALTAKGKTQYWLAHQVGMDVSDVYKAMARKRAFTQIQIERIFGVLEIDARHPVQCQAGSKLTLSERIRARLKDIDMPVTWLAQHCAVSESHMYAFLSGKRPLASSNLERVIEALNGEIVFP